MAPHPKETPQQKEQRVEKMHLAQAARAVDDLAVIEQRARDRVADAEERLAWAQADLDHVLNVEIPKTKQTAADLGA